MELYTIGFTQKTARQFFGLLREAGIQRVLDVRLSNQSQLAGFSKKADLEYFLGELCHADYVHDPRLAPSKQLFTSHHAGKTPWPEFERVFTDLLDERHIAEQLDRSAFARRTALLCSEPTPEHCHRRLVAEYLQRAWGDVEIVHL